MKNNICTLGQVHHHCNPNEEADKSLTSVVIVGALLICPQVLSLFHLDASLIPGSNTFIFVGFALRLLEPSVSLCTAGCKCL